MHAWPSLRSAIIANCGGIVDDVARSSRRAATIAVELNNAPVENRASWRSIGTQGRAELVVMRNRSGVPARRRRRGPRAALLDGTVTIARMNRIEPESRQRNRLLAVMLPHDREPWECAASSTGGELVDRETCGR